MDKIRGKTITEPYGFLYKVKPVSLAQHKSDAGVKIALVFALCDSQDEAQKKAAKLLARDHWKILTVKIIPPLLPLQIISLETLEKDCYKRATKERIAYCILENWPNFLRSNQYK